MSNAEIIDLLPDKENLRKVLKRQRAELYAIEAEVEQLRGHVERRQAMVATLDAVSGVYEGVALKVDYFCDSTDDLRIDAVGDNIRRHAKVYLNANNKTTWGLNLYSPKWIVDRHFGHDWTKEAALEAAKRFVATGEVPEKL